MNPRAKATTTTAHPVVVAHRRKMDSINETTMPALEALNARLDRAIEKAQADEDREDEDEEHKKPASESEGEAPPQETVKP